MKTDEQMKVDRDDAIKEAREILSYEYCILDTETTGLYNAQMCQIAVLHKDGKQFKSLVKPTIPIEVGASNVHHITDEMVKDAPDALQVLMQSAIIDKPVVIYNAPFDTKVIRQSLDALNSGLVVTFSTVRDAMQIYSKFRGEWNDYYQNYRWHKLEAACNQCGIIIDVDLHDAMSDVIMTERLLKYIAEQKLSMEVEDVTKD